MVSQVLPGVFSAHFEKLKPHFEDFERAAGGEVTADELKAQVEKDARQCWIALDGDKIYAVGLTEITKAGVWVDFCNGVEWKKWREPMIDAFKKHAADHGKVLKIFCRPGWSKWLSGCGLRTTHHFMEAV